MLHIDKNDSAASRPHHKRCVCVEERLNWVVQKRKYQVDWETQKERDKKLYKVTAPAPLVFHLLLQAALPPLAS